MFQWGKDAMVEYLTDSRCKWCACTIFIKILALLRSSFSCKKLRRKSDVSFNFHTSTALVWGPVLKEEKGKGHNSTHLKMPTINSYPTNTSPPCSSDTPKCNPVYDLWHTNLWLLKAVNSFAAIWPDKPWQITAGCQGREWASLKGKKEAIQSHWAGDSWTCCIKFHSWHFLEK